MNLKYWVYLACLASATTLLACSEDSNDSPEIDDGVLCGNSVLDPGEECDDGNVKDGDGCSSTCKAEKEAVDICGDGEKTGSEGCDDGNEEDGDGCSSSCAVEENWTCEAGHPCVHNVVCGDGYLSEGEACDDGNTKNEDGCSDKCTVEESYLCNEPGKPCTPEFLPFNEKKSIKILGIGNSFMQDSTVYLYEILKEMGYEDVTVGFIYDGGKTVSYHASKIREGENDKTKGIAATYYLYKNDKMTTSSTTRYVDAIKSEPWDYVMMQQYPSGLIDSYNSDIDYTIGIVNKYAQKTPEFGWSMTWGFQTGSPHYQMPYHGHNQLKMYEATVTAVKEKILTNPNIKHLVPVGTAIQNLRNGILSDNLNRDGYHMSLNNGRFAANLLWAKVITKRPIGKLKYTPGTATINKINFTYTEREVEAIKEAVLNAYKTPFQVTYPEKGVMGTYITPNAALEKVFTDAGHRLDEFTELPFGVVEKATYKPAGDADVCNFSACYIDTTSKDKYCFSSMNSAETGSKAADLAKYAASRIYSVNEIPPGSYIVLKSGYQYTANCWSDLLKAGKNQAVVSTAGVAAVNDAWWGSNKYCAFTLSKTGAPVMSDAELAEIHSAMAIFVPKYNETDKIFKDAGYDLKDYNRLDLSIAYNAYWLPYTKNTYPTEELKLPNANTTFPTKLWDGSETAGHYVATRIFRKDEIPNGSVIVADKNMHFYPDGWIQLDAALAKELRPAYVQSKDKPLVMVVDDKWWSNFNYRGFDITMIGEPATSKPAQLHKMGQSFAIYVPKK